jgi:hypothetical protein
MRVKPILIRAISLLAAGTAFGSVWAPVRAQNYFGLSAGGYQPEDKEQNGTGVFDLRGGYRILPSLGFEWSVSRVNLTDMVPFRSDPLVPGFDFDQLELQSYLSTLDLSFQWFPRGGNLVVFGGPGVALLDGTLKVTFLGESSSRYYVSNIFTTHAGLAYVKPIKGHFFLRPEARVRRYFGYKVVEPDRVERFHLSYKGTDYQAALTFGWRFGS